MRIDLDDDADEFLSVASLTASFPAIPILGEVDTTVEDFGLSIVDGEFVLSDGLSITVEGITDALSEAGVPEILRIDRFTYEPGPADGSVGTTVSVAGALDLEEFAVPVESTFSNLTLDLDELSRGNVIDAIDFKPAPGATPGTPEAFTGLSVSVGPIELGPVSLSGTAAFGKFNYIPNGSSTVKESIAVLIEGEVDFGVFGVGASFFMTEFGPVAMSLEGSFGAAGLPIGSSGLAIKNVGGKAILGAPALPTPSTLTDPLDLLKDETGQFDFADLLGTPTIQELIDLGINSAQVGLPTWEQDLLFALKTTIGINGDTEETLVLDLAVGTRIEVLPSDNPTGLQLFGLGQAFVLKGQADEINLGKAGLLLSFPETGPQGAFAFEMTPADNTGSFNVPAKVQAGGVFVSEFDEDGEFEKLEIRIKGEVEVEGFTPKEGEDGDVGEFGVTAGGILVFEAPDDERDPFDFYGAIGATLNIDGGELATFEGELFIRLNTTAEDKFIDPAVATEILPRLIIDGQAVIPRGFGLFANVAEAGLIGLLNAEGNT